MDRPWLDSNLGLQKAAKYYYYPGFHEPGPAISLSINKDLWESLSVFEQRAIQTATSAELTLSLAEFNSENAKALQTITSEGIEIRRFSEDLLQDLAVIAEEVIEEYATVDDLSMRVHKSYKDMKDLLMDWIDISDRAYMNARRLSYSTTSR